MLSQLSLYDHCGCLAPTPNHLHYSSVGFLIPDSLLSLSSPAYFTTRNIRLSLVIPQHSTELFHVDSNQENRSDSSHLNQKQLAIWVVKELQRKTEWRKSRAHSQMNIVMKLLEAKAGHAAIACQEKGWDGSPGFSFSPSSILCPIARLN